MSRTSANPSTFIAAIFVLLLFAVPLAAQQPGPTPINPNDPAATQSDINNADMRSREFMMGNSRKVIRGAGWGPEATALPQIQEDFEKLQLTNKELMVAVFANNQLHPKYIAKATSEIQKRASRLIQNLAYPKPDEPKDKPNDHHDSTDIRLALSRLDSAVMSFVTNPIFQSDRKVINAELAKKVSSDLQHVVKLSEAIRRQANDLSKTDKHP